jgi:hypothetical protein
MINNILLIINIIRLSYLLIKKVSSYLKKKQ